MSYIKRWMEDIYEEYNRNLSKGYNVNDAINEIHSRRRRIPRDQIVKALRVMNADLDGSF